METPDNWIDFEDDEMEFRISKDRVTLGWSIICIHLISFFIQFFYFIFRCFSLGVPEQWEEQLAIIEPNLETAALVSELTTENDESGFYFIFHS